MAQSSTFGGEGQGEVAVAKRMGGFGSLGCGGPRPKGQGGIGLGCCLVVGLVRALGFCRTIRGTTRCQGGLVWGVALGSGGGAAGGNQREYKTKIKPIKKRPVKVLRSMLDLVDTLGMVLESGLNKGHEQRMWTIHGTGIFGVKLGTDKPRMPW